MQYLEYEPQQSRPDHPVFRERRKREQLEAEADELLVTVIVVSMLLFVMTAVALWAAGWL